MSKKKSVESVLGFMRMGKVTLEQPEVDKKGKMEWEFLGGREAIGFCGLLREGLAELFDD
jgi:hypothetical protein